MKGRGLTPGGQFVHQILLFFLLSIEMVIGKSYVGDWFLIYLMGQNIDSVIFKDVIHELAKKLGYRSRDIGET